MLRWVTGQHVCLIRRCFLPILSEFDRPDFRQADLPVLPVQHERIEKECLSICKSLTLEECLALKEIAQGRVPQDSAAVRKLSSKHLLAPDKIHIQIPLLAIFARDADC